ncbi:MAG TPA: hypothetical protein VFT37_07715 [Telluria sp.]|nr:hypothetical protein [Telluria sp.]
MALKTRRAFDEHTAQRFVELAGIPDSLARDVLGRPAGQTRNELVVGPSPDDARRKRPRIAGEGGIPAPKAPAGDPATGTMRYRPARDSS